MGVSAVVGGGRSVINIFLLFFHEWFFQNSIIMNMPELFGPRLSHWGIDRYHR